MPRLLPQLTIVCLLLAFAAGPTIQVQAQGLLQCPAGSRACGTQSCCPYSQICSPDGYCYQQGQTYCGNGRICPRGQVCTDNGLTCAPVGSSTCGPGVVCSPGTVCVSPGHCARPDHFDLPTDPGGTANDPCQDGGDCLRADWFRCEETGSQCRPGFKCSRIRGCVPVEAVDCGKARWCHPGEICLEGGGCAPAPAPDNPDAGLADPMND